MPRRCVVIGFSTRIFCFAHGLASLDKKEFKDFIYRKSKERHGKGVFLDLIQWEDFLDAMAENGLQAKYNEAIRECDIFVMLFFTKVGKYTEEEFETAVGQFKETSKLFVFTYFKDAAINLGTVNESDMMSLFSFKKKLAELKHYLTTYKNIDELKYKFNQQLEKLAAEGFITFHPDRDNSAPGTTTISNATLSGSGAIAQGQKATAVGAGGVVVIGKNTGNLNTGTQTNVDFGGDFTYNDKK
jgi:hypothetical protein